MKYDIEKIRKVFADDKFLTLTGVHIEEVTEEYTLCSMKIDKEKHLNELGTVQGGAIATLADSAAAVVLNAKKASMDGDTDVVSRTFTLTFLKPAKGNILFAKAKLVTEGRKTAFCKIKITDNLNTKVAYSVQDGFRL